MQHVSYEEYMALKQEKEETEVLLEESLNTIQLLKEKYDETLQENQILQQNLLTITQEKDQYKQQYANIQELIKQTRSEMLITKKLDEMLQVKAKEKGLPNNAIEISKAILRSEIEFQEIEKKLVNDLRKLADESCDCLVEIETDHSLLLEKFSGVSFEKKEERDPYKGIPRKSTVGQPVGFLFGSPSKRFPISPDMQDPEISLHEVEEIDEIAEEEEEEGEYDR